MPRAPTNDCCTTVRDILERAWVLLGDQEHVRWTPSQLVAYIDEALQEILTLRPDAFTETRQLVLHVGRRQLLPPDCWRIVSVDALVDGQREPVVEVPEYILRAYRHRRSTLGRDRDCYRPLSWSRDTTNHRVFYVDPPVPEGAQVAVEATVVVKPRRHSPDRLDECVGVDGAYDAQVLDWVLARAYEMDIESDRAVAMAKYYRDNFYKALSGDYVQESRFQSGKYLGRTEEGETRDAGGRPPGS